MAEVGDVTLNIYKLSNNNNGINTNTGNFCNWTSRLLLPAIGMGAYHTSITVAGTTTTYTFAAQHGIVQSRSKSEGDTIAAAAAMMVFQESLFLGYCRLNRGQVQEIIQRLNIPFAENSYHLVHRNCNHFTETLATALLKYEELMEAGGQQKLSSANTVYPVYINRLANTSSVFIGHDEDIVVRSVDLCYITTICDNPDFISCSVSN